MGMDQYVYAETGRLWWRKSACVAYWRKNNELSDWIITRLTDRERGCYQIDPFGFTHELTTGDLAALAADDCELAATLGVDLLTVVELEKTRAAGFRLVYFSSS